MEDRAAKDADAADPAALPVGVGGAVRCKRSTRAHSASLASGDDDDEGEEEEERGEDDKAIEASKEEAESAEAPSPPVSRRSCCCFERYGYGGSPRSSLLSFTSNRTASASASRVAAGIAPSLDFFHASTLVLTTKFHARGSPTARSCSGGWRRDGSLRQL